VNYEFLLLVDFDLQVAGGGHFDRFNNPVHIQPGRKRIATNSSSFLRCGIVAIVNLQQNLLRHYLGSRSLDLVPLKFTFYRSKMKVKFGVLPFLHNVLWAVIFGITSIKSEALERLQLQVETRHVQVKTRINWF
jgi:hypothetical protein